MKQNMRTQNTALGFVLLILLISFLFFFHRKKETVNDVTMCGVLTQKKKHIFNGNRKQMAIPRKFL